jgi:hypothetical protein
MPLADAIAGDLVRLPPQQSLALLPLWRAAAPGAAPAPTDAEGGLMTLCPTCSSPCRLPPGGKPTVLISVWESDVAERIAFLVREWQRMLNTESPPYGCSVSFWQHMSDLVRWYAQLPQG